MTTKEMIEAFDAVNYILFNYKDLTVDQLCQNTKLPKFKVMQLCEALHVSPRLYKAPTKRPEYKKYTNIYEKAVVADERKPVERPKASYDNIPSPYGIYSEMVKKQE